MQLDRMTLGKTAKDLGFVRDTLEKVYRLVDILTFIGDDNFLSDKLALKGGTAINLTIFDLPRLSVDIDMDYSRNVDRNEMLKDREVMTGRLRKYMTANGYTESQKSKFYHALDSFVYEYVNAGGVRDNIKIEINYMMRVHVLPLEKRVARLPWEQHILKVLCVAEAEIFASKLVALMNRSAPRDLYDIYNMVRYKAIPDEDTDLLRKCAVFYSAIAAETVPREFSLERIGNISPVQIKRMLEPVLRRGERFHLPDVQQEVKAYLEKILIPKESEQKFWKCFAEGDYRPELVFDEHAQELMSHPMALWKCSQKE